MNFVIGLLLHKAGKQFSKKECKEIRAEAERRYEELDRENRDRPKALKRHTDMCMFPSIAVYESLVKHGMERETAIDLISAVFYGFSKTAFRFVSLRLHLFGGYHRYPAAFVRNSMKSFSPASGFVYRMPEQTDPAAARFDIVQCPYHDMCCKYNCPELNRVFCDSDEAKYSHLHPKLAWKRNGTLGSGADCCDFLIVDTSKGKMR